MFLNCLIYRMFQVRNTSIYHCSAFPTTYKGYKKSAFPSCNTREKDGERQSTATLRVLFPESYIMMPPSVLLPFSCALQRPLFSDLSQQMHENLQKEYPPSQCYHVWMTLVEYAKYCLRTESDENDYASSLVVEQHLVDLTCCLESK